MQHSRETKRSDVAEAQDEDPGGATGSESATPSSSRERPRPSEAGQEQQTIASTSMSSEENQPGSLISPCVSCIPLYPRGPRKPQNLKDLKDLHVSETEKPTATDNYSQTYLKFMQNLSTRRCIEILNDPIDYRKRKHVFYRDSCEMLLRQMEEIEEDGTFFILQIYPHVQE